MHYNYRWLYASFISVTILLLGFILYVQIPLQHLLQLQVTSKQWVNKLAIAKKVAEQRIEPIAVQAKLPQQATVLTDLALSVEQAGLQLQSMTMKAETLHLDLQGQFTQVAGFIATLQARGLPLLRFTLTATDRGILHVLLDVLFQPQQMQIMNPLLKQINTQTFAENIFCRQQSTAFLSDQEAQNELRNTPLNKLRMVGYLSQGERVQALIALPTTLVVAIMQGMRLGREQGLVQQITSDQIVIVLTNHTQWVLKI